MRLMKGLMAVIVDWIIYFVLFLGLVFFACGLTGVDLTFGQMCFISILLAAIKS